MKNKYRCSSVEDDFVSGNKRVEFLFLIWYKILEYET